MDYVNSGICISFILGVCIFKMVIMKLISEVKLLIFDIWMF